jgi:signal transduction histidine kinase
LPDELSLRGDPIYLTQLLMKLIENALTHGAGVGTRVCITGGYHGEQDRAEIRLRVVDNGPGIAAARKATRLPDHGWPD